jgi:hypothetical protein
MGAFALFSEGAGAVNLLAVENYDDQRPEVKRDAIATPSSKYRLRVGSSNLVERVLRNRQRLPCNPVFQKCGGITSVSGKTSGGGRKPPCPTKLPTPQRTPQTPAPIVNNGAGGDLLVRFNKFVLPSNLVLPAGVALPLKATDYPISPLSASWLRMTDAISVVQEDDCMECKSRNISLADLVSSVGGLPTHPSGSSLSPYWDDLRGVIQARNAILANAPASSIMPVCEAWASYSLQQIADTVYDDVPGSNHVKLIHQLIAEDAAIDTCIIPTQSSNEFLRRNVLLADMNTWAIGTVGPLNFGVKWFVGR